MEFNIKLKTFSWPVFCYFSTHRDSRKLLDSSDVRRCFGPVVIEYGKVQSKVMLKFDNWHKEVLNSFGKLLNEQMIGFHREIAKVCLNNSYLMKSQV